MRNDSGRFAARPRSMGRLEGAASPGGRLDERASGGCGLYAILIIAITASGIASAAAALDLNMAEVLALAMMSTA